MNPTSTRRLRRATAAIAMGWALLAIVLSMGALRNLDGVYDHPFSTIRTGAVVVVESLFDVDPGSAVDRGDELIAVNGVPIVWALNHGIDWLEAGVPNRYLIRKSDGRRITVDLPPVPVSEIAMPGMTLVHVLVLLVAMIYLAIGAAVWWLKPDRSEAWALVLFCSAMAAQLSTTTQTSLVAWAWPRMMVNLPLIGATTFHLFTTYPIEPGWIVRHRRIQLLPYGAAFGLGFLGLIEEPLGLHPGVMHSLALLFTIGLFAASLSILGIERHRHREGMLRDHADVMFWGAVVSFVPILLVLVAQWVFKTPYPYYITLLWGFLFPVAVGYGIVRKQLFDVRWMAKSSAAYGIATLAITGVFAFLITFADTLVSRLNVNLRWFQVSFLFVAILLFNPLRNRMQALVDGFFDRDRAAYRVAVREISEAMVSMLSLSEISDRILVALTDTMGVQRAMVLLVDDDGERLRPVSSRGDWDSAALTTEIPSDHPIWKNMWMRREELTRVDFADEVDIEVRGVPRCLRHSRSRVAGPDSLRSRSARRDRCRAQALG